MKLLKCHHNDLLVSHYNINKTAELLSQKYYWKELTNNIKYYV